MLIIHIWIFTAPRQCTVCGILAEFECKECFEQCDIGLQSISFCRTCLERVSIFLDVIRKVY